MILVTPLTSTWSIIFTLTQQYHLIATTGMKITSYCCNLLDQHIFSFHDPIYRTFAFDEYQECYDAKTSCLFWVQQSESWEATLPRLGAADYCCYGPPLGLCLCLMFFLSFVGFVDHRVSVRTALCAFGSFSSLHFVDVACVHRRHGVVWRLVPLPEHVWLLILSCSNRPHAPCGFLFLVARQQTTFHFYFSTDKRKYHEIGMS